MINKALLKEQLKRFWAVSALAGLAYALFILLPLLNARDDVHLARQMHSILSMHNPVMLIIFVFTPLIAAFCVKRYFFSRKASTVFYAFPANKKQLLITNALAGMLLCLLPLLLMCLALLVPVDYYHLRFWNPGMDMWDYPALLFPGGVSVGATMNTFPAVFLFFLRAAITKMFYFGLFWLAFSIMGHGFPALLVAGILPFIPAAAVLLVEVIGQTYVFGLNTVGVSSLSAWLLVYTNPALWHSFLRIVTWGVTWDIPWHQSVPFSYILYTALTIGLFVSAYAVSRLRKPERTGNSVMFGPVKQVLVFLVSVLGMIFLGAFMFVLTDSPWGLHTGFVLGFILGYLIGQMIAEKTFLIGGKIKELIPFGGTALGLYLLVLFVTQVAMNPVVNHIPNRNNIEGVYLGHAWTWSISRTYEPGITPDVFIRDGQIIEQTMEAHRLILDNRSYLHDTIWRTAGYRRAGFRHSDTLPIHYLLNDGSIITRRYRITDTFVRRTGIGDLLYSREVILSHHPVFRIPQARIAHIEVNFQPSGNDWDEAWRSRAEAWIFEPWQIDALMRLFADAAVENALAERIDEQRPHISGPHVRVPAQLSGWVRAAGGPRQFPDGSDSFWVQGEAAERIAEQLAEWGFTDFAADMEN